MHHQWRGGARDPRREQRSGREHGFRAAASDQDSHTATSEPARDLRHRFAQYVLDGQSVVLIAVDLARTVQLPVTVVDWLDETVCVAQPDGAVSHELLPEAPTATLLSEARRARWLDRNPRRLSLVPGSVIAAGLVVAGESIGAMVVEGVPRALDRWLSSQLAIATEFASFVLMKRLAVLEGRREASGLLLRSLLDGSFPPGEAGERARILGIRLTEPVTALLVGLPGRHPSGTLLHRLQAVVGHALLRCGHVVCGDAGDGRLLALLQAGRPDVDSALELVTAKLAGAADDVVVAAGTPRTGLDGVRRSSSEAEVAFATAGRMGLTGLVRFADLRVERLLSQIPDGPTVRDYVATVTGALDDDPEALRTLEAYLDNGGNKVATAAALPMHRSSLAYRLRKIAESLDVDLEDPERRLELWLALKLRRMLSRPHSVRA